MSQGTWISIVLVLVFVLLGGVFAATEIALVSLRDGQLKQLEERSKRGQRLARLARNPNRYLSAVQIGVTLAGFFSAAYGASTIAPDAARLLENLGIGAAASQTLAMVVVTLLIAYISLVLGELVPKRMALQRATGIALLTGPPLDRFAGLMRPVIWLLSASTNVVVRLLGGDPKAGGEAMDSAELRGLVAEHEGLDDDERRIVTDVFEAGERSVAEAMRPRPEVVFFEADEQVGAVMRRAAEMPHSRYPVVGASVDDIVGFVHVRDLFLAGLDDESTPLSSVARPILPLPESRGVLSALSQMQSQGHHIAIVVDEYGGTAGIVTLEDLMEEVVGEIWDEYDDARAAQSQVVSDPAGPVDVDGRWIVEEFAERTSITLPVGTYETVAGYVLAALGRVPTTGDSVEVDGRRLEVSEMDGWRIVALRLLPVAPSPPSSSPSGR